jgi:hypothetical protein
MGIERTTFLIDKAGRIAKVWRKVKVPGHAEEVLAAVKDLSPDPSLQGRAERGAPGWGKTPSESRLVPRLHPARTQGVRVRPPLKGRDQEVTE